MPGWSGALWRRTPGSSWPCHTAPSTPSAYGNDKPYCLYNSNIAPYNQAVQSTNPLIGKVVSPACCGSSCCSLLLSWLLLFLLLLLLLGLYVKSWVITYTAPDRSPLIGALSGNRTVLSPAIKVCLGWDSPQRHPAFLRSARPSCRPFLETHPERETAGCAGVHARAPDKRWLYPTRRAARSRTAQLSLPGILPFARRLSCSAVFVRRVMLHSDSPCYCSCCS